MSIVNYPLMAAGFLLDLYENESIRRQSRHVCDCDYSIQMSQRIGSAWSLASLRFMVLLHYVNKESEIFCRCSMIILSLFLYENKDSISLKDIQVNGFLLEKFYTNQNCYFGFA